MTVMSEADTPAVAARARGVVALCFAIALLEGFDIQAVGVAAPRMIPALNLGPQQAGLVFGGGMFGLVVGALLGGWLADRVGRRWLLTGAVVLFGLFTVGTAMASDFAVLLAVRLMTGLGLGMAMPVLVAIALEVSHPAKRAQTVTTMFCGMPVGGALSGLIATVALDAEPLGWRAIFILGGLVPLLLLPWLARLPETRAHAPAATTGVRGADVLFAEGRLSITLLQWLAFGLTLLVLYLLLNWLPTLVTARQLGATTASLSAVSFNLASVAGALFIGRLVDRFGPWRPIGLAYLGLLGAMIGLTVADQAPLVLFCAGAAGFCLLGAQYSLYGVGPMYYPAAGRGLATGAAVAVGRLGSIVGPLVAGQLMATGAGPAGVAAAMAPVVIVAGLAATVMTLKGRLLPD